MGDRGARASYDAVVIGSGPNGLSAAIAMASAGLSVLVLEARDTPGGGARTAALTLPGFAHDVCSAVHPLGVGSPYFSRLPLEQHGLEWVQPPAAMAHPFDDGSALTLERSVHDTAAQLGPDERAYRALLEPFAARFEELAPMILAPLRIPRSPLLMARFGLHAIRSMDGLARARFRAGRARALLAGVAAHAMLPLDAPASAAIALVLGAAGHAVGWPVPRGGAQRITDALVSYLRSLGGELETGRPVRSMGDLPPARAYLFDLTPRQLLTIAGDRLPPGYRRRLQRFRYGPGVFKIDWALDGPIPWSAPGCLRAATVHLGASLDEMDASEAAPHQGRVAERPFVLVTQPSLFDDTRAPAGGHTAWAYCHVPNGDAVDMRERIESQVERFAPGFRARILARHTIDAPQMEAYNPNYVGGDINGGLSRLGQLFFRPVLRLDPYSTPADDIFLCSSSTPPGGGVHGMSGYWAARSALRRVFGVEIDQGLSLQP